MSEENNPIDILRNELIHDISDHEKAALEDWSHSNDDNRSFRQLIREMKLSSEIEKKEEEMKSYILQEVHKRINRSRYIRRLLKISTVAASIAILLGMTGYFSYKEGFNRVNSQQIEMSNPFGMLSTITLPDGSKVINNNLMKNIFRLVKGLLPLLGLLLSLSLSAQGIVVKGHVKDATGESVIGANILIKGTSIGTISDVDGNFTLKAATGNVLTVTCIGYKGQEITVTNKPLIIVTMQEDSELLDEVVVIGYGQVKKGDVTGSLLTVKPDEQQRQAIDC